MYSGLLIGMAGVAISLSFDAWNNIYNIKSEQYSSMTKVLIGLS